MLEYENHIFVLCLLVFLSLTIVFTTMTVSMTSLSVKLIRSGWEDNKIVKNYLKTLRKSKRRAHNHSWIVNIISVLIVLCFALSIYIHLEENRFTQSIPSLRVVKSNSMSSKNDKNAYLYENNLNDQFSAFDLIVTHQMPLEEQLKLYDVVVYEIDGVLVVHRIVGIEEPNEKHPRHRKFLLQGDAVASPDRELVLYEQMKGIYKGKKLAFAGSFVLFLQSPAGYMCIALIILFNVALPLMERKIDRETKERLVMLARAKKRHKKESP